MARWWRSVYVPCLPQRFVVCALAALGGMLAWAVYIATHHTLADNMEEPQPTAEMVNPDARRCDSSFTFGSANNTHPHNKLLPSSFYLPVLLTYWVGLAVFSVVGGLLADTWGPRWVWSAGAALSAASGTLMVPSMSVGAEPVLACVVVLSAGHAMADPCTSVMLAYWAPADERTLFVAFTESTYILGLGLAVLLEEYMSELGLEWDDVLIVCCVLILVWMLAWNCLYYNLPAEHPKLPPSQLQHLQVTVRGVLTAPRRRCRLKVPWRRILTSPPYLSLLLYISAASWVGSVIAYNMNRFLTHALAVTSLSTATSLMMVGMCLSSVLIYGWVGTVLVSRNITSRTANRRLLLGFSSYLSAAGLLAISFLGCTPTLAALLFLLTVHFQGIGWAAMFANVVDLSPRYAGLLRGLILPGQCAANIVSRIVTRSVVTDRSDLNGWAMLFRISAAIVAVFSFPHVWFGSGEIQPWNYHGLRRTSQGRASSTEEQPGQGDERQNDQHGAVLASSR